MKISPDKINLHPFCAAIIFHLQGKDVEINGGDTRTIMKFNDFDYMPKNIIRGKIEDAMGDCLIVLVGQTKVFLNVWGIKSIIPVEDSILMKNVYEDDEFNFKKNK
mgnify:CR=1 FL=1|jgi:hypothetical protein